jgi:tRNA modification GTPase
MYVQDTIFALSSGHLPSGIAVIRVSGGSAISIMRSICGDLDEVGRLYLRTFRDPASGEVIDIGLAVRFLGPKSFTGEDCCEFHVHGGQAVVRRFLDVLNDFDGCRIAEPGEFSKRAFENGKLDLTEIEGLSDLIAADTELQRQQALRLSGGVFRRQVEEWRAILIRCRAYLEAEFDFSDEEGIPDDVGDHVVIELESLVESLDCFLDAEAGGEIVREGYRVAITGRPNAGKSSLLNALAKRDIAIVSEEAGTTRDVLEVKVDIAGIPVIIYDTAGIREPESAVEREGIRRAIERAEQADLVIWLSPEGEEIPSELKRLDSVAFHSKIDLEKGDVRFSTALLSVSVERAGGLDTLLGYLRSRLSAGVAFSGGGLLSRARYKCAVGNAKSCINTAINLFGEDRVLASEELRIASNWLGRITGNIDVEDLLDVIFSEFCVGK